jgi:hypothetical protein
VPTANAVARGACKFFFRNDDNWLSLPADAADEDIDRYRDKKLVSLGWTIFQISSFSLVVGINSKELINPFFLGANKRRNADETRRYTNRERTYLARGAPQLRNAAGRAGQAHAGLRQHISLQTAQASLRMATRCDVGLEKGEGSARKRSKERLRYFFPKSRMQDDPLRWASKIFA